MEKPLEVVWVVLQIGWAGVSQNHHGMSLVTFEPPPYSWSSVSDSISKSKFMHRPFKRNTWASRSPLSLSATILAGFHSQKLWILLFSTLEPWAGDPGVGPGPLVPQGEPP